MQKYRLILSDPPWQYNDQGTRLSPAYEGKQRKSGPHYDTMTLADICALGEWVRWITEDDAILLLWSTHPIKQTHPWPVIKAWGFRYSTAIPWIKARWDVKLGRFVYQISGGKTTRACSEELLVCLKGKGASLVTDRGIPGAIIAPRTTHSKKPVEQYDIAERMVPGGPWLELFARGIRPGWSAWGDGLSG
ncbi:MAG TPA: hypothetical protein DEF34_03200 [Desulfotomaculum sp.]|nr:MAG: hypothetical protein JL56_02820 [Desulfotomaculum sp. BICA1-6]HBX22634.1 hypothetical protein [Desulfotomaculum sp.]